MHRIRKFVRGAGASAQAAIPLVTSLLAAALLSSVIYLALAHLGRLDRWPLLLVAPAALLSGFMRVARGARGKKR